VIYALELHIVEVFSRGSATRVKPSSQSRNFMSSRNSLSNTRQTVKKPPLVSFVTLASLILVGMFGVLVYLMFQPEDLSDVDGYKDGVPETQEVSNLLNRLARNVSADREIVFTEEEINHYVERLVTIEQTGALADAATFDGVAIRLEADQASIIFDRTVRGNKHTISIQVRASSDGKKWVTEFVGGKVGQLHVPGGAVRLSKPSITDLAKVFSRELEIISNAGDLTFLPGKLIVVRNAEN